MKVQFVGVGEAFDETLPNNSQILQWEGCRLLIDCGYAVPHMLWRLQPDPDYLDAIYLSHRHADHYFGLPSYLVRLAEDGRQREILILCPQGMSTTVQEMIEYAYQGVLPKLDFPVVFQEVSIKDPLHFRGSRMEFAVSSHPVRNFALAVYVGEKKYAYSGDGNFNEHTRALYKECSLLVHEAYWLDEKKSSHANIADVLQMAKEQNVRKVALTHIQRGIRKSKRKEIDQFIQTSGIDVIIPEPGDIYEI
ncbi:MAG TPA: ribonuclease Z [Acidobacteriota bacterium]|nr:ribonuclease Z [Acidobacteriota bacterium]